MWFDAQEMFIIVITVENSCAAQYFCENHDTFLFKIFLWIECSKE